MKEFEKNYYPRTNKHNESISLADMIYYWLQKIMFSATPGMNVLVASLVRVPN